MPSIQQCLRVAVIGAGPAGLGALLALHTVDGVDVQVYEQARELREVGAGISLHYNTWTVLEKLGVPYISPESFHRNADRLRSELWNARTGALLKASYDSASVPEHKRHVRTQRSHLQQALLKVAPKERIHLQKRLSEVEFLSSGEVNLKFEDGFSTVVDLVVGADGIRSIVRRTAFPSHTIAYSGRVGYRSIFPISLVEHIPDLPRKTLFWLGPDTSLYTTPIGDGLFEVSGRGPEPKEVGEAVSWGQPADKETMKRHFTEYLNPVARAIVDAIPPETIKQFAFFGGPQLQTVVSHGSIALLGDASHPLSGAFGSGAAFALEDAWTLAQALSHALSRKLPLFEALRLFDETRSPYYSQLFEELRHMGAAAEKGKHLPWDERVADRIDERWGSHDWIYLHDVEGAWQETLKRETGEAAKAVVEADRQH